MSSMPRLLVQAQQGGWIPQVGDRVRIVYRGKSYDGVITKILDNNAGYIVECDDLLMPVVCSRSSLKPVD